MTDTSRDRSILSEVKADRPISVATLAYFRQRLRNHLYEMVLGEFLKQEAEHGLTKAMLARRIRRDNPSQITRWLSTPSNLEVDTISDLMVAMGAEPKVQVGYLDDEFASARNDGEHEWLDANNIAWANQIQRSVPHRLLPQNVAQAKAAGVRTERPANESGGNTGKPMHPAFQAITASTAR